MCSDWKRHDKDNELSLNEIEQILRNPLFNSVEKFVLSGGEPTLREDLVQIAGIVLESCPRLQEMSLLTNGLDPDLVTEKIKALLQLPGLGGSGRFAVSVSLDGYGDTHEAIRRVPQAFDKVSETIRRLKEVQRETPFYLSSTCVVQHLNVRDLPQISEFGQELGLPVIFSPVCNSDAFIDSNDSWEQLRLTNDQLKEIKTLFEGPLESRLMPSNLPFWREYFHIMQGDQERKLPCYLRYFCANVDSDGTLRMCSADSSLVYGSALDTPPDELWYSEDAKELRKRADNFYCPRCTICCDLAFCFSHEFFYYSRFLLKEKTKKLIRKWAN
jgi:MoaA/NifB/PqqE/SkfB family radical SAM enzyme